MYFQFGWQCELRDVELAIMRGCSVSQSTQSTDRTWSGRCQIRAIILNGEPLGRESKPGRTVSASDKSIVFQTQIIVFFGIQFAGIASLNFTLNLKRNASVAVAKQNATKIGNTALFWEKWNCSWRKKEAQVWLYRAGGIVGEIIFGTPKISVVPLYPL